MASGTADLQRDLGGAVMQSILGALLTAGYAAGIATAVAASPEADEVTTSVETQLQKSFAGAESIAQQFPQYADQIVTAAKTSFLDGADWAYLAGIIAIVLGAVIITAFFPRKEQEEALLARYHEQGTRGTPAPQVVRRP
jgi:DHA2 family multidrug resistance protein-like MFS transporter